MDPRATPLPKTAIRQTPASNGLTFLEVLIVLAVLGLLATIALPSIGGGARSHRVVRQAREVHAALAQARARALAEQRTQRFQLLADGRYRLQSQSQASGWSTYLTSAAPSAPISLIGGSGDDTLVFGPDGRVDAPATILVGEPPKVHEIRILAGGLVQWHGPSP